jgi:hypothetical protein
VTESEELEAEELAARRIAARGREAVVERLRPAFSQTLASLDDQVAVAPEQLEALVQAAADRAGGAVWRRALAGVAMNELGLSLAEAVDHPSVQRAQEMLGAPVYQPVPTPSAIRVAAVHLGGIETLPVGSGHLELLFSEPGLDVIDTRGGEVIGRLGWEEIASVDLTRRRRSVRRRGSGPAELVVRTDGGLARFALPGLDEEQARQHLTPVLGRARGHKRSP